MRAVFPFLALLLAGGCGGGPSSRDSGNDLRDVASAIDFRGVSFTIEGVPIKETELRATAKPAGPPSGWTPNLDAQFFVQTPKQTVDHPARLTFPIDADRFDDVTRGQADQLGVFAPGGLILGPCDLSDGRADPDPCIASRGFLENGDGRIVVLASEPATS